MRTCPKCHVTKATSDFYTRKDGVVDDCCRRCASDRARAKERVIRVELLNRYGNQCACCGESDPRFLALDHVNGGGARHRSTGKDGKPKKGMTAIGVIAKREGYPQDGRYQLLCHNCNMAKGFYGACPHSMRLVDLISETTDVYGHMTAN